MSASPAYAHVLKRSPVQARSVQRVEDILDAAADLLRDRPPEAVTLRDLAAAAHVPTGTIYQFFTDKNAVLQALAVRFVNDTPAVMDGAVDRGGTWIDTLDRVVDFFAAMVRAHPAIRQLWLSGTLDASTRSFERATDATLAVRLGALLEERARRGRQRPEQWRTLVALIDGLLRYAFADDSGGDPAALAELRRAARAYTAAVLDDG